MKIRNGYVSNSSSSSFVVAGYLVDDKNRERFFNLAKKVSPEMERYSTVDELIDEEGYEVANSKVMVKVGCDDNGIEYGKTFFGISISISDDDNCGMDDTIIDVDEIKNDLKEFEDMFEGDEKKMKIIAGTMLT